MALTLPLDAPAQTLPTVEQCNDSRLLTLEKRIYLGDGIMTEGQPIAGHNAFQVNRAPNCNGMATNLLNELPFCMNIWDTTPCNGASCGDLNSKIQGGIDWSTSTTYFVCGIVAAGSSDQIFLVAATNDNAVRDDPTNRFIVALANNPHQNVVFEIRDND